MTWSGITDADLRAVAGDLVLHRGRELAADGALRLEHLDEGRVRAVAAGTALIEVELELGEHGLLLGDCTCPAAQSGSFCAHLVATAMACRDRAPHGDLPAPGGAVPDTAQLRRFLRDQDPDWLVEQLLLAGERDPHLRARWQLAAGGRPGPDVDISALHAHVQHAFFIAGFVSHREAGDYFARIDEALDLVEALIDDGHPDAAADLALRCLRLLEESSQDVEDPGGGTVRTVHRLEHIHHRACRAGAPDPEELAATLLDMAATCTLGPFRDAPARYAEQLGPDGLARLAALLEERLARLPAHGDESARAERAVLAGFRQGLARGADAPPTGGGRVSTSPRPESGRAPDHEGAAEAPLTVLPHDEVVVDHGTMTPLGARLLDRAIALMNRCTGPHKDAAFAGIGPRNVVELGAGGGANLDWLPAGTRLYAVEPNRTMHPPLRSRCARAGVEVEVLSASAERLPLPDACVDEVLCSLVLCTVPDVDAALAEVLRVLRPGGRFRFVEHVAAPASSARARAQRLLRRPWGAAFGGCDPHRDTLARIEAAGFRSIQAQRGLLRRSPAWPVNTVVWGWAVR